MNKKLTRQEVYDAFKLAMGQVSPEAKEAFSHVSEQWDDLTNQQKALFREMAWKLNLVIGEMEVD